MSTAGTLPIRVLIVDDHAIVRQGLRLFFASYPGIVIVGETATCTEALTAAAQTQPDIIVLDLAFGAVNAVDFIPELLAAAAGVRIVVFTGVDDPALQRHAVSLGAIGVVSKDKAPEVLLQAITKVHAGQAWLERTMIADVLGEMTRTQRAQQLDPEVAKIATLTPRERAIIALIGEGLKNRQIAARLCLSEITVRHHLTTIFDKLGVIDRLELVVYAYRHGLAKPSQ
jgi:two-component system, NarL family, nitrate/nitrite response regulator NarL